MALMKSHRRCKLVLGKEVLSAIEQLDLRPQEHFEASKLMDTSLYVCFVDYERAFDSVYRETLWMMLGSWRLH